MLRPDADVAAGREVLNALVSDLPSRNGWTMAEQAGDLSPTMMQRLLNRASWDEAAINAGLAGKAREFTRNGSRMYLPVSGI